MWFVLYLCVPVLVLVLYSVQYPGTLQVQRTSTSTSTVRTSQVQVGTCAHVHVLPVSTR